MSGDKETIEQSITSADTSEHVVPIEEKISPPANGRAALLDLRRQLNNEELLQSGTQKLLLEMLYQAETERDEYRNFQQKFHDSDKTAAILLEKLKADRAVDILFTVGIGLGGTILGLSSYFGQLGLGYGMVSGFIGLILMIGACIGRVAKR